jgi:hypothetical protein
VSTLINNRIQEIKAKGFDMISNDTRDPYSDTYVPTDFSKIKVGVKSLEDAVLTLGDYKKVDPRLGDKKTVMDAIHKNDLETMRAVSNFFYRVSGIYGRLCKYLAYMYKYDWMVTPYINEEKSKTEEKALTNFHKVLNYLDNFNAKRFFSEVALKVIKNGCYYGYVISNNDKVQVQELPIKYCRSRYQVDGKPAIEFNMKYFDDMFKDANQKMKVLNLFPKEFKKGYVLYKEGKLVPDFQGDTSGWYLLDINSTVKFNINGDDFPVLISVIPAIIDLDAAQDLDRKKMAQRLLKIIIQKMPLDKNGDLVFDVDEAQALHNNAVKMLSRAIGVDVLTTFADVEVADMADKNTTTTVDDLEKVERTVYNEAGISQMQFNTDGNIALEKSMLNDEASIYNLVIQFEDFLNYIIGKYNTQPKKIYYRVQILPTTIYNYKEVAKLYKDQMQLGFSKMLPQIAMGQTQSSILANAYFENDILDLVNVFIPPMMSSTMNSDVLNRVNEKSRSERGGNGSSSDGEAGRPTNESQGKEVTEKTIQNKESQS